MRRLIAASMLLLLTLVGFVYSVPWPATAGTNLLTNGGFESGATSWLPMSGGFTVVSSPRHGGSLAAELTCIYSCWLSQDVSVAGGAGYTLTAWAVKNNPDEGVGYAQIALEWFDASFTPLKRDFSASLTADNPSFLPLTIPSVTAPPTAQFVRVKLKSSDGAGAVYFDDASLVMVSPPPDTATPTITPTATHTPTPTQTPTLAQTHTSTPSRTPTTTRTPTLTFTPAPTHTPTPTALPAGSLTINEVLYRPAPLEEPVTPEARREWIEFYNALDGSINLANWTLDDGEEAEPLPPMSVPPKGFAVLAGSSTHFLSDHPSFAGILVEMADGSLGNGLANMGDSVALRDNMGRVVDAMSYGDDATALDPACPTVPAGHSLEREPAGYDTDRADDFVERENPSPGGTPNHAPTSTATVTATATSAGTPTSTPSATPTVPTLSRRCLLPVLLKP